MNRGYFKNHKSVLSSILYFIKMDIKQNTRENRGYFKNYKRIIQSP